MMTFDAIYYTDNANDAHDGHRLVVATGLQDAKAVLKATLAAEGISYVLHHLVETKASFAARR